MSPSTNTPVQIQIQRSIALAAGTINTVSSSIGTSFGSNNVLLLTFYNQPTYPLVSLGNFYFIDAPNVSHLWDIKNASLNIRNFFWQYQHEIIAEPYPELELEFTIEYLLRSAGVPILAAIEHKSFTLPKLPSGIFKEVNKEVIVNYEAVRSQYIVPGSGIELAIAIRNINIINGTVLPSSILEYRFSAMELNINLERTPN